MIRRFRTLILPAFAAVVVAACAMPFKSPDAAAGERWLAIGINQFGEGQYGDATKSLQASLQLPLNPRQQVQAHKYLAFIHCVSGRERLCREEFGKAFEISPGLELAPAEAGHPIWGPVFRGVKAKRTDAKK